MLTDVVFGFPNLEESQKQTSVCGLPKSLFWLRRIIKLLLEACLLEIYLFCSIWSEVLKNCFQQRLIFY